MKPYRICTRCVMDTSDPDIDFNENGECNLCSEALERLKSKPYSLGPDEKKAALDAIVVDIKSKGNGKRYDCIIGLSGGIDSSYLAFLVKRTLGLRPLAVHLDNGWNSETSMHNIESICKSLDIDLFTYVIDWEEFKDLQLSFLKASTPDSEIPTDHAIVTILYEMAAREKVSYILGGTNFETESILPKAWSRGHTDWRYIKAVQTRFGEKKLKSYPHRSFMKHMKFKLIDRTRWVAPLDYVDYDKDRAKETISRELGWRDYGRKHGESSYTRIFQEYILPVKFGYDKRRGHLSSLIIAGRISREQALSELQKPLYESEDQKKADIRFICSKFGISEGQFGDILSAPKKTIFDYPSYEKSRIVNAAWKLINHARKK
jgi:N-acetyl sugar amidotransferase